MSENTSDTCPKCGGIARARIATYRVRIPVNGYSKADCRLLGKEVAGFPNEYECQGKHRWLANSSVEY